ncbi:hypothetical protein [Halomarina rubra]|nr:hypothetical protein [Halomarina rubra]
MLTQNARYLLEHGPSVLVDLPGEQVYPHDREDGVRTFSLTGSAASSMGGPVTMVAYHVEHDRTDVLRAFYEENPRLVETKSYRAIQKLLGKKTSGWKDASREIRGEFFDEEEIVTPPGTEDADGQECPRCGTELSFKGLPAHLRSGCDAGN